MEYEIQDEDVLFDDSTNPSLKPDDELHPALSEKKQADTADKRTLQKAEVIPEEEHQVEEEHQLA